MIKSQIFNNWRGLNRLSDRQNMPPDFLYDLLNGYIKKDVKSNQGVVMQREGCEKYNSVALDTGAYGVTTKIRTVFEAKWDTGSTNIIARAGTAWGMFDTNSFGTIDSGRSDDVVGQCVMFKNELIMVDGGVPRKMTSASVVSNLSSDANMPQNSSCVWVHRDKVWLNDTDTPMIAYFCKTNSANTAGSWTGATDAGTIDLSTVLPIGDEIMGFRTYGGVDSGYIAIICKNYTVLYAAGTNTYNFTFTQMFPTTCLSISACDYVGTDLVYPSRSSLTSLFSSATNQLLDVKTLSKYIEPLYRDYVSLTSTLTNISGVFDNTLNLYYITFPIVGSYQTLVYSHDIGNFVGRWTYPFNIYSWCKLQNGAILSGSDGYVYTMNTTGNDDGTAINFIASMPALYFGDASRYKKPIDFEALFYAEGANPTISLDYWYGGLGSLQINKLTKSITLSEGSILYYWNVALWNESYWADVSATYLYRTSDLLGRGRFMMVDLSHNTLDSNLKIDFIKIGYTLEGSN